MACTVLCRGIIIWAVIISVKFSTAENQDVPTRPTFPDMFQVEVQGIFKDQLAEADGVIYYDRSRNRAALSIEYQNESSKVLYFFDDNEMVTIRGFQCTVESMPEVSDKSFFPFTVDKKTNKKKIAPPEDILRFTNSEYEGEELALYPSYIYKTTIDVPMYNRKDCEVMHIFSKPEIEIPTCEGHACQPTIVAISVHCPGETEEDVVDHVYDFYRFRSTIRDEEVFQSPAGLHCARKNKKPFPILPQHFSFSYEVIERQTNVDYVGAIAILHKKVWFDGNRGLIRMDEYDDNGFLTTIKLFDYSNGAAYTILTSKFECNMGSLPPDLVLDEVTTGLPSVIFSKNSSKFHEDIAYVGKRKLHGLDYEIWSFSSKHDDEALQIVKEIYFTQYVRNDQEVVKDSKLQLSYAEFFNYEENDDLALEMIMTTFISITNFKTEPKDWSAYDVGSCYMPDQKKKFEIKVSGPDIWQNSAQYSSLLFQLHEKLLNAGEISVTRISELKGIFDSNRKLTSFVGFILENPMNIDVVSKNNTEPDILTVYKKLEAEVSKQNFLITIPVKDKEVKYLVSSISSVLKGEKNEPSGYTGGSLAAASLIMLILGILFGSFGYYVFLKKRKSPDAIQLVNS